MQASSITPSKKPRHSPHHQKGRRRNDSHSQLPTQSEGPAASTGMPPLQYSELHPDPSVATLPVVPQTTSVPITPPRPRSMYEGAYNGPRSGNASASDGNSNRRKRLQKTQNQRPNPSSSRSRPNGTPRVQSQTNIQTPGKSTASPSHAYAGPTFHASPAPSSLPIPKFFQKQLSKSVPETNQIKGLAALMDSEVSEEAPSPESGEATPVGKKAEHLHQQAREESPLDIFFRADREEKTRARLANITNYDHANTPKGGVSIEHHVVRGTPSPVPEIARHHSQQHTCSSTGGLFPIDLEQERPQARNSESTTLSVPHHRIDDLSRANSTPSNILTEASHEDIARRTARSAELMKLLGTEKPKKPPTPLQTPDPISTSATPTSNSRPTRELTGPFAPTPQPEVKVQILSRKAPASLPQLQKQFGVSPSTNQSPRARPPSNLRQEVPLPSSPAQDVLQELPATPTPSRIANGSCVSDENHNLLQNNIPSPLHSSALPGVGSSQMPDPKFSSMENDLRRILRLDMLGSDGANGVKS